MGDLWQDVRAREFARLDAERVVYLDYTGSGLYPESLVRAHGEWLSRHVLGNPHSRSPSSGASTERIAAARERIRRFFDAEPEEYEVIFTPNATGALKLVGESYPFRPGSRFVLTADNHNSVNGIREFAAARGGAVQYVSLDGELRVAGLEEAWAGADPAKPNLFAYPAQSNFSGVRHPLEWIPRAQELGYEVLLDAAAFVSSHPLSLRRVRPDFVAVSFYKMFGFPTGVGVLLARRRALAELRRPWFAGGTVRFVSAKNRFHMLRPTGEAFEDGTLNFLSIAAVADGLEFLDRIGMERIEARVTGLTRDLLEGLAGLKHGRGTPLVKMYGPATTEGRGGTVAFNVLDQAGRIVDHLWVEQRASEAKISLRTGSFCNPGAAEFAFDYVAVEEYQRFQSLSPEEFVAQQFSPCLNDRAAGAVRTSLGLANNESDIRRLVEFLGGFRDLTWAPAEPRAVPAVTDI